MPPPCPSPCPHCCVHVGTPDGHLPQADSTPEIFTPGFIPSIPTQVLVLRLLTAGSIEEHMYRVSDEKRRYRHYRSTQCTATYFHRTAYRMRIPCLWDCPDECL